MESTLKNIPSTKYTKKYLIYPLLITPTKEEGPIFLHVHLGSVRELIPKVYCNKSV